MISSIFHWRDHVWSGPNRVLADASLVLVFGSNVELRDPRLIAGLRGLAPTAIIVGCSTAGEIVGATVSDGGATALFLRFDSVTVRAARRKIVRMEESEEIGCQLAGELVGDGLRHVFVLSDGLHVNGSALAAGLRRHLPEGVSATGGLAGDGADFKETTVLFNGCAESGQVVAVGLYGANLQVGWGSAGGWEAFGPKRLVTRAKDNVLYELDGKPALSLYKTYLGERAEGLPATGLLFPLQLLSDQADAPSLVRTISAVDEAEQSLTFAGDVPAGRYVRLMKSTIDKLVWGAEQAAQGVAAPASPEVVLLVSCVGRRLLLGQRVEEEVEAVLEQLGNPAGAVGFYSYGEIAPGGLSHGCEFHNQTMTLTTLSENVSR